MTIMRKIKRIVLLKREESNNTNSSSSTKEQNDDSNGGDEIGTTTNNFQMRGRSSSCTTTTSAASSDLMTPLVISNSTSSLEEDSSPPTTNNSSSFTTTTMMNNNNNNNRNLNSPALDYATVKGTKVSSSTITIPQINTKSSSNCVDEQQQLNISTNRPPFISKTPRGVLQSTPSSAGSTISSSPNTTTATTTSRNESSNNQQQPKRANTMIGGGGKALPVMKMMTLNNGGSGGGRVSSAITPVAADEFTSTTNKQDDDEQPKLKKTKSASIITVKKKVIIYTQPQKSDIIAPPILENAAKFSLIQAVNNEQQENERMQLKTKVVEEPGLTLPSSNEDNHVADDVESDISTNNSNMTSPVNVYSPRAFENGLHFSPRTHARPSFDEISGNPSKLYAFLEDGDLLSVSPRRRSTVTADDHRRSTVSKASDTVGGGGDEPYSSSSIDLVVPAELDTVIGNYGHASLEKLMHERNKHRGLLRGIRHSLSLHQQQQLVNSNNNERMSVQDFNNSPNNLVNNNQQQQTNQTQNQPTVHVSHHAFELNHEESTKITSYNLFNCSNMIMHESAIAHEFVDGIKSFYPIPEGSLTFEIKTQSNEEKQLTISFKAKKTIDADLHKIIMNIISGDCDDGGDNIHHHELEDYVWSITLETSSDIPTSREVLRRIISENQKESSQGFQFKSFSHLATFIGNSIQEEIKKRLTTQQHSKIPTTTTTTTTTTGGDQLRMALVFSQNDYTPNGSSGSSSSGSNSSTGNNYSELNIQTLLKDEKVPFNFTNCIETHYRKEIVSCSSKILFLCVHFYSSLLDSDIQFKIPLLPNNSTMENSKKSEHIIHTLEEQVSQLESELEEILYQKYMWEFLMKYTFKVFDSRIIDTNKVVLSNQKRTLKYIGEKQNCWTSCVCRCPITPGRFVDTNLGNINSNNNGTNSSAFSATAAAGDLSSLKTNHVLTLRLDSFPTGSDIYVGIINANHTSEHILQNYVVSGKSDSHSFFLKDKQFRHGSLIINSTTTSTNSEYSWTEGDVLQVVLNYSNLNIQVYRNYNQCISPSFSGTSIDLENMEWYFIVGLNQNGQQLTII